MKYHTLPQNVQIGNQILSLEVIVSHSDLVFLLIWKWVCCELSLTQLI